MGKTMQVKVKKQIPTAREVEKHLTQIESLGKSIARFAVDLSTDERRFLLSLVAAEPEWSLLGVEHLEQLPGLQWKLQNLERLRRANPKKFAAQSDALAKLLA